MLWRGASDAILTLASSCLAGGNLVRARRYDATLRLQKRFYCRGGAPTAFFVLRSPLLLPSTPPAEHEEVALLSLNSSRGLSAKSDGSAAHSLAGTIRVSFTEVRKPFTPASSPTHADIVGSLQY